MHRTLSHSLLTSLIFSLVLILLVGCADDLRNRRVFDCEGGEVVIRFSVEDVVLTRDGESQDFESIVDHAYLLFYATDASLETDSPVAVARAELDPALPGNLKFKMPMSLEPNTDYQLLAVANADNYVPSGFNNYGEYLEHWCMTSSTSEKQPIHLYSSLRISPANKSSLPMRGVLTGNPVFRFTIDNGAYNVTSSLSFRRMVARIDVANIVQEGFKIESVALCNWRDAVPVAYSNESLGNRFGRIKGSLSEESAAISEESFVIMPVSEGQEIQQLNREIYCFPSIAYNSRLGDEESTALIIKAKYGSDTESTYYRINVGMSGNVSEVKPNTKYLVTIQSVKGRGASSPEEAYRASESLIVLSVVEGWDIEGNAFAMDDNGNFMVLSKGSLAFEGDATENIEVRVLTSRGLNWTADYIDDEAEEPAFVVSKLSDTALAIRPNGENENDSPLTGVCRVSAVTANGNTLTVNISLSQAVKEEKPYEPVIPDNMPFALIPDSYDRVKIDHNNKTIEIDGFDPNCFNSFIDISFNVYINESISEATAINISTTLEWPLEGRVSEDVSLGYTYCKESFGAKGTGKVYSSTGSLVEYSALYKSSITVQKGNPVNISVGAMGPDDPAIVRDITLSANGESIVYNLIIKPRPAIIDDVVLKDDSGNYWLVQDRNVQDSGGDKGQYVGRRQDGSKYQAYNYSHIWVTNLSIPFKFKGERDLLYENSHDIYRGKYYKKISYLSPTSWLNAYVYESGTDSKIVKTSPFYEESNISAWILPNRNILQLWQKCLKVSKLRMYFVSDYPAKNGKNYIPICSYLPYECSSIGNDSSETYGYFFSLDGVNPESINIFYISVDGKVSKFSKDYGNSYYGLSRLVRPLTLPELDNYTKNYLGYESKLKLSLCHPDTYTSEGWIAR